MNSENRISRRRLLKRATGTAAGLALPYIVPSAALGKAGSVVPSSRIRLGCIGTGGMGRADMSLFLQLPDVEIVAVCDVKPDARAMARTLVEDRSGRKGCVEIRDFRELAARDDIDAVLIASTDHWHVLHALEAVRAGKDVYLEKPMGLSLQEIKTLRGEVHRHSRTFQFGTQQRSMPNFRLACELVRNGRIGELKTIKVSAPDGFDQRTDGVYDVEPVPDGFDYEMWLGPAPWAPYTSKRVVNPHWFHISDYSLGYIAGWGIHHIDIAQWGSGMELSGPVEVEGSGLFPDDDALCDNALNWDVRLKYANGIRLHFTSDTLMNKHGIRFEGTEGWVFVNRGEFDAEPKSLLKDTIKPNEIHLPVSVHHQRNFIDSVKTREPAICNIDVAVRSDTVCTISDIAMRLGRPLKWNPEKEEFVDDMQANMLQRRAMRSPWHL